MALRRMDQQIRLTIGENGQGFHPKGDFPGYLGLQSMRQRVAAIDGNLQIISQLGQGTIIMVQLPLSYP